jgi:SET domain-containing protein
MDNVTQTPPAFEIRKSGVHGLGAFALRPIKKGERVVEYLGDRVTHAEADRRYEDHDENDNHTFLFIVDKKTVIDAGVGGNDARFINHSCDPNCESVISKRRVFIEAIRDIATGEELGYDYQIGRERGDPLNVDEIYACRCGAVKCRGTMLWPPKRPKKRKRVRAKSKAARPRAKRKTTTRAKSATGAKSKAGARSTASAKSRARHKK